MNVSMKQLQAFFALLDTHNFTQAAQRVHLSQPAFSSLIASLEHELGYKLFDRDTRSVRLNQHGVYFTGRARKLLNLYETTLKDLADYRDHPYETVTLAVMPSIVAHWLPSVLTRLKQQHPNLSINLIDAPWSECLNLLLTATADFAMTTITPSISDIQSVLLFRDAFYLACHQDHPLATQARVTLADVRKHRLIGFRKGTSLRLYTDMLIEPHQISYSLEINQLTTMLGLIMANYGVGIVTQLSAFQFKQPDICLKALHNVGIDRPIYLASHLQRPLSEGALKFKTALSQADAPQPYTPTEST
ncbi:MAG: LysR family transcriptional regulator [Neisseriaceae bacterium]|nr:LysR family transcriptional regulator [Neisseriaceae bacterium]MBP6861577.1 LysR family transcriptional regulator [Neisseriaceae bacterium]